MSRGGSRERDCANAILRFYADWAHGDFRTRIFAWDPAMAVVVRRNPTDDEALIFHGLSHIAAGQLDPTDTSYHRQREAAEELSEPLACYPDPAVLFPRTRRVGGRDPALASSRAGLARRGGYHPFRPRDRGGTNGE
jgi:hypothetical protein